MSAAGREQRDLNCERDPFLSLGPMQTVFMSKAVATVVM